MATRTCVIHPFLKARTCHRTPAARLEEACGLAGAIAAVTVVTSALVPLASIRPAAHIGKGKVAELAATIAADDIELVVMDCALSPVQQRNLEQAWRCKVIDRTALILEIFGERARTREGILQVELAALEYQKSRLVRSWTHLERQRGGYGFLGGPGETQIEIDRRLIRDRIARIKRELEKVRRTRGLHRASRQQVPYPVIALVGYTNAGKSTLFNRLAHADVFVKDLLFATLDPTMRVISLPSGGKAILSDTVGFIADLPTELVAAFRATLEEVIEADLIVHVRDIASPDSEAQRQDVIAVLKNLGLADKVDHAMITVLNKTDLLASPPAPAQEHVIAVSALTGEGCAALLAQMDAFLSRGKQRIEALLDAGDGRLIAWLYAHAENVTARQEGNRLAVSATLSPKNLSRFHALKQPS